MLPGYLSSMKYRRNFTWRLELTNVFVLWINDMDTYFLKLRLKRVQQF